jgi:hypothetical protein
MADFGMSALNGVQDENSATAIVAGRRRDLGALDRGGRLESAETVIIALGAESRHCGSPAADPSGERYSQRRTRER